MFMEHIHQPTQKQQWVTAVKATLHCLTGCLIGDLLGMFIGTSLGFPPVATFVLAISLAFIFGYTFTTFSLTRSGLPLKQALTTALAADTISIATMEIVANSFVLATGAIHHSTGMSLTATLIGFIIAFIVTVPVNRFLINRGLGHAKAHAHHHI